MKRGVIAVVVNAVLVSGCATTQDFGPLFNEKEFAWSAGEGNSTLRGQAFARTLGGDVRYCAGVEIYLVPVTAYTKAIGVALQEGRRDFAPAPDAYKKYRRTAIGDGTGNFEFVKIPAGAWYVGCNLVWYVPGNWGMQATGAVAERRVDLKDGEIQRVVVTPDTMSVEDAAAPAKPKKVCVNALWC